MNKPKVLLTEKVDFENIEPNLTTFVFLLSDSLNLHILFYYLEPDILNTCVLTKTAIKSLPILSPGSIVSMCYNYGGVPMKKGIDKGGVGMKNAIVLDMSMEGKNVNMKIFTNKINLTGTTNFEVAMKAVEFLLTKIKYFQTCIDSVRDEKYFDIIDDSIIKLSKQFIRDKVLRVDIGKEDYVITRTEPSPLFRNRKATLYSSFVYFPENLDTNLGLFIYSIFMKYSYWSEVRNALSFIINEKTRNICDPNISILQIDKALTNYDYYIGFKIDREKFVDVFRQNFKEWTLSFNPSFSADIFITVPYDSEHPSIKNSIIKRKEFKQTLRVRKSGAVTQFGPDGELAKELYDLFTNKIIEFREFIEDVINEA